MVYKWWNSSFVLTLTQGIVLKTVLSMYTHLIHRDRHTSEKSARSTSRNTSPFTVEHSAGRLGIAIQEVTRESTLTATALSVILRSGTRDPVLFWRLDTLPLTSSRVAKAWDIPKRMKEKVLGLWTQCKVRSALQGNWTKKQSRKKWEREGEKWEEKGKGSGKSPCHLNFLEASIWVIIICCHPP